MVAAGAGPAIGEEDGVAEFAGVAVLAGVEFAVNEDSHADAFVDVQEDHIFKVLCAGASPMTERLASFSTMTGT